MAETSGIRRKVDDLGRVVIPSAIRKALGLAEGDEVEVSLDGDRVVLERAQRRCVFCGADDETETFRDKAVCWSCMAAIRALDRERTAEPASPFPF
ncbi:MAG TPA: AbrB/MazE/SpoVT family DNA-binding domain-containing protein [Egibacteraceae bacterium]